METTSSFGYWIRRQRKALDLTQRALAEEVGCSLAAIKKIESDERRPSLQIAERLADILGVPANQRKIFLECARGVRPVDQLSLTREPVISSPATKTKELIHHNLPTSLTSFIGRKREIAEIQQLLSHTRLLTLAGPGGTGKTRLAIQVANEIINHYPNGVWLVELAPILDPLLVPRITAIAIGLRDEPQRPVIDMLCDYLRDKKLLLILDNCEHLIEACSQLADTLLHTSPKLCILVTSREVLGVAGETSYLVPSLELPDMQNLPTLEELSQYEAVRLFIERTSAATQKFKVTDENASSIVQICQHLDGIPLAIELAAGKIRVLSAQQIAQHLDDRFHLLTGGSRTALPRHQTLQAAIDWSYNLLSRAEQILFRRLSVFVGSWRLEAAESVCSDRDTTKRDTLKAGDILELLTQLVNKSLVTTEEQNGEVYYHMLETIRQFASDKLREANENESLRDRHLEYCLSLAETAAPYLIRPEQLEWLARLEAQYKNIRAALEWALGKERPEYALRLAAALGLFWYLHSYWLEGIKWLESVLAQSIEDLTSIEKIARARALYWEANIAQEMDKVQRALISAKNSMVLCEVSTDRRDLAIARFELGWAYSRLEDYEHARPLLEQSLKEFLELQEVFWETITQHWLSNILFATGEKSPGETLVQYLKLARRIGERLILAVALSDLANWEWRNQEFDEAQAHLREYAMICDQLGMRAQWFPLTYAWIAHCRGDLQHARLMYTKCLEQMELIGDSRKSNALQYLGILERDEGNYQQAQSYLQEALEVARQDRNRTRIGIRLALLGQIEFLQGNLENPKHNFREGLSSLKMAKGRYSKSNPLLIFANTYADIHPQVVARILGAIHSYYDNIIKEPIDPLMLRESDKAIAQARQHLDESTFNNAWTQGEKMSLDEVIDLALNVVEEM